MRKISKKFGFALIEAIGIMIIVSLMVLASTSFFSKKVLNNAEAGAVLSGGLHGRYEAFSKEIISFGSTSYEKTINPEKMKPAKGAPSQDVVVFRRLYESEFNSIMNRVPKMPRVGTGENPVRETLYEQIDDAIVYKNPSGRITHVSFKLKPEEDIKKHLVGGSIIVENANVSYIKVNSKTYKAIETKASLPNANNRIIEGYMTKASGTHPASKRQLWLLDIDANKTGGMVTSVPWYRKYSGNKVYEGPIEKNKEGKYVASFDPGENAKNIIIHAVGGGGAGGAFKADKLNGYIPSKPGSITTEEAKALQKIFAARIKEHARNNPCQVQGDNRCANIASASDDKLVKYSANDYSKGYGGWPSIDDTGMGEPWVHINTSNGSISVKFDPRYGMIYPHQLLDYTYNIGSHSQQPILFKMPRWFNSQEINSRGFWMGETVWSGDGGDAGDKKVNSVGGSQGADDCLRPKYVAAEQFNCTGPYSCMHSYCDGYSCGTKKNECCSKSYDAHDKYCCDTFAKCQSAYSTSADVYGSCPIGAPESAATGCGCGQTCDQSKTKANKGYCKRSNDYWHTFPGGIGGSGVKATTCHLAMDGSISYNTSCPDNRDAKNQPGKPDKACSDEENNTKTTCKVGPCSPAACKGEDGQDCRVDFNTHYADTKGGKGGKPSGGKSAPNPSNPREMCAYFDLSLALPTGPSGANGDDGTSDVNSGDLDCSNAVGLDFNSPGLYNYAFVWTIPYTQNKLAYGEAGQEGEYRVFKLADAKGKLDIELGLGGVWHDPSLTTFEKGFAPNGTDTIIKMTQRTDENSGPSFTSYEELGDTTKDPNKEYIEKYIARGGRGGSSNFQTYSYDLCYAKKGQCSGGFDCCDNEKNSRSSRDIKTTSMKESSFEYIKSQVGNSLIVGIGLGRGAEGAGSRAGLETVFGKRMSYNPTGYNLTPAQALINSDMTNCPEGDCSSQYQNTLLLPSSMNFKGGDGAVIITW